VLSQFSPHDWTAFQWEGTASFLHYITVVLLLAVFLIAELNPFYLKVRNMLRHCRHGVNFLVIDFRGSEFAVDGT
jgi:hypothetical protein